MKSFVDTIVICIAVLIITLIGANTFNNRNRTNDIIMGVFQITAQNSPEEYSWGGAFNTTSRMKTASITMKLQYQIK